MLKKTEHFIDVKSTQLFNADCLTLLKNFPADAVDLVITSPPYAAQRNRSYGGITPDNYVNWFTPIAAELYRTLKNSGSFVLNIKENVVNGERHTYVIELIMKMREIGWLWTEEYIWHKKNSFPGKWPNRFRDSWERCLHFTKHKKFAMYQDAVKVPMGDWRHSRLKNMTETDRIRDESKVGSGFGKKVENWVGRDMAFPTNVLHMATECRNRSHSAAFPESLPEWFIKLFTQEGDVVLDPFSGSGTTIKVADKMGRIGLGIEIVDGYCTDFAARMNLRERNKEGFVMYAS